MQVMEYIGATRRETVWNYVRQGKLPKPRYLAPKQPVWRLGEVIDHLEGVYVSYEEGVQGIGSKDLTEDSTVSPDRGSSLKDKRKAESIGLAQKLREKLNLGGLGRKKP